eukprot:CAMPEP_0185039066 /NCGR_PEP_ID=MMETSP1103-20130426/35519_1 /TAXON_ID=36769 /ORGANISM="Paraphysomonas bandaiensis, Strain Caron Lab Isolate" /LENGTH=318 /DNA_ID=CAMNT_0027577817 /DNA_START=191 /DNA_END=1147 /DNA_ORIENTATION=-
MGPGFDSVGMAIDMWTEITVERSDTFGIVCEGEGADDIPTDETNLVCLGMSAAFTAAGKTLPVLKYHLNNRIPYARGLGSSSAAIVGGLVAGLVLAGHTLETWGSEALFNLAAEIEGHPDNVAPAIYGGVQIGIHTGDKWISDRVHLPPGMQCVFFIPNSTGKTSIARGLLSDTVTRADAVFNIGRVAWLINALATSNIEKMQYGVQDRLHQPQRAENMYPHLNPLIDAAVTAGASAVFLSGAGPTVMAISSGLSGDLFTQLEHERVDKKVAQAMLEAAEKCNIQGGVFISKPTVHGAYVASADPAFSAGLVRYAGDV